jgi:hypothetical protein
LFAVMRILILSSILVAGLALATGAWSQAAATAPSALQGERMVVGPGAGTVVRDPRADQGRLLRLTGRGTATARLRGRGSSRLGLRLAGRGCGGDPRVVVALDGTRVISRAVRGTRLRTLSPKRTVAAGTHVVTVRLANPHRGRRCVRSLRVDRVALEPMRQSAGERAIWRPAPRTTWQWQLSPPVDESVAAEMYDIDLEDSPASLVASLRSKGRRVVCYLSAGSREDWRPDASAFPAGVLGERLDGWPRERWLDIRRLDVLGPIMERRLDECRAKGFDGVEADNVDGYKNASGFALRASDQLAYNRFLAREAHARGLSIGLKNDLDQVAALEPDFDWALNEECFRYDECEALAPFVRAGKAVFNVEYGLKPAAFCGRANTMGFMSMAKSLELDAARTPCW